LQRSTKHSPVRKIRNGMSANAFIAEQLQRLAEQGSNSGAVPAATAAFTAASAAGLLHFRLTRPEMTSNSTGLGSHDYLARQGDCGNRNRFWRQWDALAHRVSMRGSSPVFETRVATRLTMDSRSCLCQIRLPTFLRRLLCSAPVAPPIMPPARWLASLSRSRLGSPFSSFAIGPSASRSPQAGVGQNSERRR